MEYSKYVQQKYKDSAEWETVSSIADKIHEWCNEKSIRLKLDKANRPKRNSKDVQDVLLPKLEQLGFSSEARGLFNDYKTRQLRPDYYLEVEATGIIVEVERGQTTINNADLRDLWKCHICKHADYLFIFVPVALKHKEIDLPNNAYARVNNRLESFFDPEGVNYTNVRGLVVFGY